MSITENQTARFKVNVAGTEIQQEDAKGLEYLCVEDHVDMIGICELTFSSDDGIDWSSMTVGADVEVQLGGSDRKLFKGTITGFRHAYQKGKDSLTVLAMDHLLQLASSRNTKVFSEMKDSEVASSVLGAAGRGVATGTVDATTRKYDHIFQRNESDFNFLRRLAARNGYVLMANEGKIDFKKPQTGGSGTKIPKSDLISMDYSYSPREVPEKITAYGWDYVTKKRIEGTAGSGDISVIGGGTNVVSEANIFSGTSYLSDILVTDQGSAKLLAEGEINRLARNFLRGRASVQGNADLFAGGMIQFEGHRTGYNAAGFLLSTRHRIYARGGFTTELVYCSNTFPV